MNNVVIIKSLTMEVKAPLLAAALGQIFLPKYDYLDGKYIQGISTYSVTNLPKTPSNVALVNNNLLKSSFLTLVQNEKQQIWTIPMIDLVTNGAGTVGFGNMFAIEFDDIQFNLQKSFITVADQSLFAAGQENYLLNIKYSDSPTGAKPQ